MGNDESLGRARGTIQIEREPTSWFTAAMMAFAPYVFLECLGALLAWALIARRGTSGPALVEAGAVWLAPLVTAGINGVPSDAIVGVASCGVVFNFVNWIWQGAMRRAVRPGAEPQDRISH